MGTQSGFGMAWAVVVPAHPADSETTIEEVTARARAKWERAV